MDASDLNERIEIYRQVKTGTLSGASGGLVYTYFKNIVYVCPDARFFERMARR